jgi:hypothetical protein
LTTPSSWPVDCARAELDGQGREPAHPGRGVVAAQDARARERRRSGEPAGLAPDRADAGQVAAGRALVALVREVPHGEVVGPDGRRVRLRGGEVGLAVVDDQARGALLREERQAHPGREHARGGVVGVDVVRQLGAVLEFEAHVEVGAAGEPSARRLRLQVAAG